MDSINLNTSTNQTILISIALIQTSPKRPCIKITNVWLLSLTFVYQNAVTFSLDMCGWMCVFWKVEHELGLLFKKRKWFIFLWSANIARTRWGINGSKMQGSFPYTISLRISLTAHRNILSNAPAARSNLHIMSTTRLLDSDKIQLLYDNGWLWLTGELKSERLVCKNLTNNAIIAGS